MKLGFSLEHRFLIQGDGTVWSATLYGYRFWERYLEIFSEIDVLARATPCNEAPPGAVRSDGPQVRFTVLPDYRGLRGLIHHRRELRQIVRRWARAQQAILLRVPSPLASIAQRDLSARGVPYGLEVVGDPWDVFQPGATNHRLRPVLRWGGRSGLRRQCRGASAVTYVTKSYLQQRYPPGPTSFSTSFSDVDLGVDMLRRTPRKFPDANRPLTVVTVASLEQPYKAVDVLIEAMSICRISGYDFRLRVVGDGHYRPSLERLAHDRGLDGHVDFLGRIPPAAVRDELDRANAFVLPSHLEGLPRALVEGMARGLPAIATMVGGIPELLRPEDMVTPGSAVELATSLIDLLTHPNRYEQASRANREVATRYTEARLGPQRQAFYSRLRDITAAAIQ